MDRGFSKRIRAFLSITTLILLLVCCKNSQPSNKDGWYLVENGIVVGEAIVTVEDFSEIQMESAPSVNGDTVYVISGRLKPEAQIVFAEATEKNIGKSLGFLYEDEIIASPRVQACIDQGRFSISSLLLSQNKDKVIEVFEGLKKEMFVNGSTISRSLTAEDIAHFDSLFTLWKYNWENDPKMIFSSNTKDAQNLEEYLQLVAMGEKIIPLIIVKLTEEDNFFALSLYDELQKADSLKSNLSGQQLRAKETVAKYLKAKQGTKDMIKL